MTKTEVKPRAVAGDRPDEHLTRSECFHLIASVPIGRIAVGMPHQSPLVLPVTFVVHDEGILFRTEAGSKLTALHDHPVTFEVDSIDLERRVGWSVLLRGFAHEVSLADVPLVPWAAGSKDHWIRIQPKLVTGRRLNRPDLVLSSDGYL